MRLLNKRQSTLIGSVLSHVLVACSLQMPRESDVFSSGQSSGGAGSSTNASVGVAGGLASSGGSPSGGTTSDGSGTQRTTPGALGGTASGGNTAASNTAAGNAGGSSTISDNTASAATGGATSASNSGGGAGVVSASSGGTGAGDGLVARYPFDETAGTVATNGVDATRNGSYVGSCTHPSGKIGGAVQVRNLNSDVSGSSDWIELPPGLLSHLSAATISLWVLDLSPTRRGARAFDFSRGAGEQFYFSPHETDSATSTEGAHLVGTHASATFVELWSTSPAFTDKDWHHVAVAWSAENLEFYIDGRSVGRKAAPGVVPSDLGATSPNWLGRCLDDAFIAFYGQFDDLRIYDRAFSASEISALYQAGGTND